MHRNFFFKTFSKRFIIVIKNVFRLVINNVSRNLSRNAFSKRLVNVL